MNVHRMPGARPLTLTVGAAAALAIGLAAAPSSPAGATSSPWARVANDTLTVIGTSHADRIALRLAPGAPGTMQVDLNDDGTAEHSFDRSTFSRIEVLARSGSDQFRVDQANGIVDEPATVSGGERQRQPRRRRRDRALHWRQRQRHGRRQPWQRLGRSRLRARHVPVGPGRRQRRRRGSERNGHARLQRRRR